MSRAKEAALKAYPDKTRVLNEDGTITIWDDSVLAESSRRLFINGYKQAEKDTIERAIEWLKANADSYIVDMQVCRWLPPELHIGERCWEDFRKAMEEEIKSKQI